MKKNLFLKSISIALIGFALSYQSYLLSKHYFENLFQKGGLSQPEKLPYEIITDRLLQKNWSSFPEKFSYRTLNKNIEWQGIVALDIYSVNADIFIESSDKSKGKIALTSGGDLEQAMTIEKKNHRFILKIRDQGKYADSSITIKVPSSIKAIKIETVSGDVKVDGAHLESMLIKTVSGDVSVSNDLLAKLAINTVSGDVNMGIIKAGAVFDLKSVSGDVSMPGRFISSEDKQALQKSQKNIIQVRTISGDIIAKRQ